MRPVAIVLLFAVTACQGGEPSDGDASASNRPAGFAACAPCHNVAEGERSGAGPNLWGVFGRQAGSVPGFFYSKAMASSDVVWDESSLDAFLAAPMEAMPGTRMRYAGIRDAAQRRQIVEWLESQR